MSKFLSNVFKLSSAVLVGQILGIIFTPILSRLYSPSDYGIFQMFFSIVSITAIISCLSYEAAIQLPKKDDDAANIVVLCIFLIVITSIFITVFFFIFSSNIEQQLNAPGLSHYLILLPVAIICNSIAFVLVAWLSRKEEFGSIAKGGLSGSVSSKVISIGYGIISPSPFGLIFSGIINDAANVVVLLKRSIGDFHFFQKVSYEKTKQLAFRYRRFPQYNAAAELAGNAAIFAPPLMLAVFFSPVIIGFYAMAYQIMKMPSRMLGLAIYQVFYQKASVEKNTTGSIKQIVGAIHSRLISLGLFACLIIMIIGPELFAFALGSRWTTAGIYAQIFAPWIFAIFISTPLMAIFNILEKQSANLWFSILLLATRIISVFIGGLYADPVLAMVLLSATGVFFYSFVNMYTLKVAGVSVLHSLKEIILYLVMSLFFCLPLIIAKYYSFYPIFLIVIAIATAVLYYTAIFFRDAQLKHALIDSFKKYFTEIKRSLFPLQ